MNWIILIFSIAIALMSGILLNNMTKKETDKKNDDAQMFWFTCYIFAMSLVLIMVVIIKII